MSTIYYIGLDVHKDTIAVAIAPADSTGIPEIRRDRRPLDALDKEEDVRNLVWLAEHFPSDPATLAASKLHEHFLFRCVCPSVIKRG